MAEMSEQLLIAEVERRLTNKYAHIPTDQVATRHSARVRTISSRARYGILFRS